MHSAGVPLYVLILLIASCRSLDYTTRCQENLNAIYMCENDFSESTRNRQGGVEQVFIHSIMQGQNQILMCLLNVRDLVASEEMIMPSGSGKGIFKPSLSPLPQTLLFHPPLLDQWYVLSCGFFDFFKAHRLIYNREPGEFRFAADSGPLSS